jgi:hypothetical protein
VGEAGQDNEVTFNFHKMRTLPGDGTTGRSDSRQGTSVAQLNECRKQAACDAATYSVIGTLLAGCDLGNRVFFREIPGRRVSEMTDVARQVMPKGLTHDAAQNSQDFRSMPRAS